MHPNDTPSHRTCPTCGTRFVPQPAQRRYCSAECASRPSVERTCEQCGATFRTWPSKIAHGGGKYCSHPCYAASKRVEYDARLAAKRRYREVHREEIAEKRRNSPRIKEGKARWQRENIDKTRAAGKRHRERVRAEMIAAYGGKCACCGEMEPTFLTLDHANGGGNTHRKQFGKRGNDPILRELRLAGWPQDGRFRLLCWNCQWGVRQPRGCPHQRRE